MLQDARRSHQWLQKPAQSNIQRPSASFWSFSTTGLTSECSSLFTTVLEALSRWKGEEKKRALHTRHGEPATFRACWTFCYSNTSTVLTHTYRELVRCGSPPGNKRTFFRLGNVALSMELINTDVFPQVSISFPNFCAWKINNQADVPVASSQLTKLPPSSRMEEAGAPSSSCPPAPAQATAQPSSCSLPKH